MTMKLSLRQIRLTIIVITLMLISGGAGHWLGTHQLGLGFGKGKEGSEIKITVDRALPANHQGVDFSVFWEIWDLLEVIYLNRENLDSGQMVYGAVKGLVASLQDPYSVFLTPEENSQAKDDLGGSFSGVGIQLGYKEGVLAVIAPLPDTPAQKAGVRAGDLIVEIDGQDAIGVSMPEAVVLIRGPEGSQVKLTVLHEGETEPVEVEITRGKILVPSVEVELIQETDGRWVHLRLTQFGDRTNGEWQEAVNEILSLCQVGQVSDCDGLILDLRNNPGGYLLGAPAVASEFISSGVIVVQENADGTKESHSVNRLGQLLEMPMVVLINQGSASASEILAGALREYDRALLVGETTFGKGTIQHAEDLEDGSGLHVTSAHWFLPSGESVNEVGLSPDFEVKDDPVTKIDEQLEKAKAVLAD